MGRRRWSHCLLASSSSVREKMETRTSPSTGQPPSEKVIVDAPWLGTASGSDLGEDEGHGGREGGVGASLEVPQVVEAMRVV